MSRSGFRFWHSLIAVGPNPGPIVIGTSAGLLFNAAANSQYVILMSEDF